MKWRVELPNGSLGRTRTLRLEYWICFSDFQVDGEVPLQPIYKVLFRLPGCLSSAPNLVVIVGSIVLRLSSLRWLESTFSSPKAYVASSNGHLLTTSWWCVLPIVRTNATSDLIFIVMVNWDLESRLLGPTLISWTNSDRPDPPGLADWLRLSTYIIELVCK